MLPKQNLTFQLLFPHVLIYNIWSLHFFGTLVKVCLVHLIILQLVEPSCKEVRCCCPRFKPSYVLAIRAL